MSAALKECLLLAYVAGTVLPWITTYDRADRPRTDELFIGGSHPNYASRNKSLTVAARMILRALQCPPVHVT